MFGEVAPPIAQSGAFGDCALVRFGRRKLLEGIVEIDQDLVQNFGETAHLYEAGDRMRLLRSVAGVWKAVWHPRFNLGRIVHCGCQSSSGMTVLGSYSALVVD